MVLNQTRELFSKWSCWWKIKRNEEVCLNRNKHRQVIKSASSISPLPQIQNKQNSAFLFLRASIINYGITWNFRLLLKLVKYTRHYSNKSTHFTIQVVIIFFAFSLFLRSGGRRRFTTPRRKGRRLSLFTTAVSKANGQFRPDHKLCK